MTKPRSMADQLLLSDPDIEQIIWVERPGRHGGLFGLFRLVADIRRLHVNEAWVLHSSARYTLALYLAGVPRILAPGRGLQKLFSDPTAWISEERKFIHPTDRADAMLKLAGIEPPPHEGSLSADASLLEKVRQEYPHVDRMVVFTVGSSEPYKQWGSDNFSALARRLLQQGFEVVLVGGPVEQPLADAISTQVNDPRLHVAINRPLAYITALLVSSRACVGNDTGVLNIALASGTTTFGLFGGSPPLTHVASLHVIQAQDAHLAMAGITVQQVYDAIVREIGTTV